MEKIIGFFGGDSQVGTTMIAQAIGEALARRKKKVLVIMASGKFGDDFFKNKEEKSLDMVKANLINGTLDEFDLEQLVVESGDISIIPGVKNIYTAKYYPENALDALVEISGKNYDYIIIDGGDNVSLGLSVSALKLSKERYYVITQQEKSIRRFLSVKEKVLNPLGFQGKIVVNKFINHISLFSLHEIKKLIGAEVTASIPYIDQGWQAEIQQKTLMMFPKFQKAVEDIVREIVGEEKEKTWIKNFVSKSI